MKFCFLKGNSLIAFCIGNDDRQVTTGQFLYLVRAVRGLGVEEKRVTRLQRVGFVGVAVGHPTFEHINQLGTGVLKHRKHFGLIVDGYQVGLYAVGLADGMTELLVLVADAGTAALDRQAFAGAYVGHVALLFIATKE